MSSGSDAAVIILAAGKGTRMNADVPKVMVSLAGKPLLRYVLDAVALAGFTPDRVIPVVGYHYEEVTASLGDTYRWVLQSEQLGTGHAVLCARQVLAAFRGTVMVLYGDVPLIRAATVSAFRAAHDGARPACSVLTAVVDDPFGYGRIIRDAEGAVTAIVEEKDAAPGEREVREINTGAYCFAGELLFDALARVGNDNAKGEYYLTDVVKILIRDGHRVQGVAAEDAERVLGVNTLEDLARAEELVKETGA